MGLSCRPHRRHVLTGALQRLPKPGEQLSRPAATSAVAGTGLFKSHGVSIHPDLQSYLTNPGAASPTGLQANWLSRCLARLASEAPRTEPRPGTPDGAQDLGSD